MSKDLSELMTPKRVRQLEHMFDREEIFDCLTRVFRGIDRADREIFLSAFHEDATIDLFGRTYSPIELFEEATESINNDFTCITHYLTNFTCEIDGDIAHTETYQLFAARNPDKTMRMNGGRMIERLERRDGEWKLAFRYSLTEWVSHIEAGKTRVPEDMPGLHINGVPSRSKDDPSYRRPLTNRR